MLLKCIVPFKFLRSPAVEFAPYKKSRGSFCHVVINHTHGQTGKESCALLLACKAQNLFMGLHLCTLLNVITLYGPITSPIKSRNSVSNAITYPTVWKTWYTVVHIHNLQGHMGWMSKSQSPRPLGDTLPQLANGTELRLLNFFRISNWQNSPDPASKNNWNKK